MICSFKKLVKTVTCSYFLAEGKLRQAFLAAGKPVNGSIRLEDFSKEFAAAF